MLYYVLLISYSSSHKPFVTAMETLSTSVSTTFRIHQKCHEPKHPNKITQQPNLNPSIHKPKTSTLVSSTTSTKTAPHNNFISPSSLANSTPLLKQSSNTNPKPLFFHRNAASGYAVALLETARRNDALEAVARDVKRMSRWMQQLCSSVVEMRENGETILLRGMLEHGKFHKHVVRLVRLLVEKNKVEIVGQVLMEFQKFFKELSVSGGAVNINDDDKNNNDQVVLVPCGVKMDENEIVGVARRVLKISGAEKVKVVRQVVHQRLIPSFAVV